MQQGRDLVLGPIDGGDAELVPVADPDRIGVRQVRPALGQQDARGRIVHHRGAALGGAGEIVGETDGVSDLVGAQLAQAGQRHLGRVIGSALARLVGAHQAFEDQHVLAHPKRAQHH